MYITISSEVLFALEIESLPKRILKNEGSGNIQMERYFRRIVTAIKIIIKLFIVMFYFCL